MPAPTPVYTAPVYDYVIGEVPPAPASPSTQNDATDSITDPISTHRVAVTFYACPPFCRTMANGEDVHESAAACSWELTLGTRFTIDGDPTGRVYTCEDRGLGPANWIDVFFWNEAEGWLWLSQLGVRATIRIVE